MFRVINSLCPMVVRRLIVAGVSFLSNENKLCIEAVISALTSKIKYLKIYKGMIIHDEDHG